MSKSLYDIQDDGSQAEEENRKRKLCDQRIMITITNVYIYVCVCVFTYLLNTYRFLMVHEHIYMSNVPVIESVLMLNAYNDDPFIHDDNHACVPW